MEFPQISCNNSISVSGSHSTKGIHTGPCAFAALSFLGMCESWEPMKVMGWVGHLASWTCPSGNGASGVFAVGGAKVWLRGL